MWERHPCLAMGHMIGCGEEQLGIPRPGTGKAEEKTKDREREGYNWFREEQRWENSGKRGLSGQVNRLPVGVLLCRTCSQAMRPGKEIFRELLARRWSGFILQGALSFGNCFTTCSGIAQVRCYSHPKAALMRGEDGMHLTFPFYIPFVCL